MEINVEINTVGRLMEINVKIQMACGTNILKPFLFDYIFLYLFLCHLKKNILVLHLNNKRA